MTAVPQTKYVKSGDAHIAYQVSGDGPLDLAYFGSFVSHVELDWEAPEPRRFYERLGRFSRLIRMDKRGVGMSDAVAPADLPTLEQRMEDVRAVLDEVGSESTALFGNSEGGPLAILFAATYPERTRALVLHSTYARVRYDPTYPQGVSDDQFEFVLSEVERTWGTDELIGWWVPSAVGDEHLKQWITEYTRRSSTLGGVIAQLRMNWETDVRHILPSVHVPTLVVYGRRETWVSPEHGRYIVEHIPNARGLELDCGDHYPYLAETDRVVSETQEFLTGTRPIAETDRVLATVLFTDIVSSTEKASELGDRGWREVLERHDAIVRHEIERYRGRDVKDTGDGRLATFDGPARAARCACAIRDAVRGLGIDIRAGLHTGEIELVGEDVRGIAVHIGARVSALAGRGEVLVSRTVTDLVAGSGLEFRDRGERELKGVQGRWQLYAVES